MNLVLLVATAGVALLAAGCRTPPSPTPINLAEPGWQVMRGQAVWTPPGHSAGLAGDLILAVHPNGRTWIQFTKTPFPMVSAQAMPGSWQLEFGPAHRSRSGRSPPPVELLWFQIPRLLHPVESTQLPWHVSHPNPGTWRLENAATGEALEGWWNAATRNPSIPDNP